MAEERVPMGRSMRIRSLLDPSGLMDHSQRFAWRPDDGIDEKLARLSVQAGRGLMAADPAGMPERLERLCAEYLDLNRPSPGAEPATAYAEEVPPYLDRLRLKGDVRSMVRLSYGNDPARRVDVLLGERMRMTTLTATRRSPVRPRCFRSDVHFTQPYWPARDGRPAVLEVDPAILVGYDLVRADLREHAGIDLAHPSQPAEPATASHNWLSMPGVYDLIASRLDELAFDEMGAYRQASRFGELSHGRIATAFSDKVPVSPSVAAAARESPLHERFGHVEYDEDIDLSKVAQMEREIRIALDALPAALAPLESFRVRKLGKYRDNTLGVYSPERRAIVVDDGKATRNGYSGLSSFVHEYAHHLDAWSSPDGPLSTSDSFRPILASYCDGFDRAAAGEQLNAATKDYLMTPTEVFARGFELWAAQAKGVRSSCIDEGERYRSAIAYTSLNGVRDRLFAYYEQRFPDFHGFDTLDETRSAAKAGMPVAARSGEQNAAQPESGQVRRIPLDEARFAIRTADGSYLSQQSVDQAMDESAASLPRADTVGSLGEAGLAASLCDAGRVLAVMADPSRSAARLLPATAVCAQTKRAVGAPMILPYVIDHQRMLRHAKGIGSPDPWTMKDMFDMSEASILPATAGRTR